MTLDAAARNYAALCRDGRNGRDGGRGLRGALLLVQALPYAAAVYVSVINAVEQMRQARTLVLPAAAPPTGVPPRGGSRAWRT